MLAPVSGWGWTDEVKNVIWRHFTKLNYFYTVALFCIRIQGGRRSNALQKVDVPILANKECQQWYKDEKKSLVIVDTAMCAGLENGGNDSCQVFRFFIVTNLEEALRKCLRCNKHICLNWQGDSGGTLTIRKDGRHQFVGVVSAGIGCAIPRLPGLYTRFNNYLDWISSTVRN